MAGKQQCGVYLIRNLVNQKVYVGASKDLKARMSRHRKNLKRNQHNNPTLQEDWNIHGRLNFDFSILELTFFDLLIERESYWMKFYNSLDPEKGYNYSIPDNSITPRDRKVRSPVKSLYKNYICINTETKEKLKLTTPEIYEKLKISRGTVCTTSSYWRGNLRASKTCFGWIFVTEADYKEDFDYVRFDKLRQGRLPVIKVQKKIKTELPPKEIVMNGRSIIMIHSITGEEIIMKSSREAIRLYNLTPTKLRKCLKAPFGKYKHHDYHFKYL